MARMGMDVDAVEDAGRQLQRQADQATALISRIDGIVRGLPGVWDGKDSQMFVNDWWPQHRKGLLAAAEAVRGLGQSALNNASEQREAASERGLGGGGTAPIFASTMPVGPMVPGGDVVESDPARPTGPGLIGAEGRYSAFQGSTQHYNASVGGMVDGNGAAVGQCTAWAEFRARELGVPGSDVLKGNGGAMAGNAGGTRDTTPTLGSLVSYGAGTEKDPGHVMVVESTGTSASGQRTVSISEMNGASGKGVVDERTFEERSDGLWYEVGKKNSVGRSFIISKGL